MAKTKIEAEAVVEAIPEKKSERQMRWDAFLARFKEQNPAKYALREEKGELEMPDNF